MAVILGGNTSIYLASLTPPAPAPAFDPDAQAYFTANSAYITSTSDKNAINDFFVGLKTDGVYSKIKTMRLPIWGAAAGCKWNLVNPVDTNAANRLTYATGMVFNSGGMSGNNVAYAIENINMSTSLTNNNTHISFYGRTNSASNDIGIFQSGDNPCVAIRTSTTNIRSDHNNYNNPINATVTTSAGFVISNRSSSTSHKLFINGSLVGSNTVANALALPNGNVYLCGVSQEPVAPIPGNKLCAFSSIGDGLTDTEAANFSNRVNILLTYFGLNVY